MIRFLLTALSGLVLIGGLSPLFAQSGQPVVKGNTFFTQEQLAGLLGDVRADSAVHLLRRAYTGQGFFDLRIASSGDTLVLDEGRRYVVADVKLRADSVALSDPDIREATDQLRGAFFSDRLIQDVLGGIVASLNRRGYALASASFSIPSFITDSSRLELLLSVVTGDLIILDEIRIAGAEETSRNLILRAMNVPERALFTDELAKKVRERLLRLQTFSRVAVPEIYVTHSGTYGMVVEVEEGGTNTFDGVVGYQPATETDEDGYFTGLVRIVLRNLFGAGETIAGRWEQRTRTTSELELGYGQPFVFGFPVDVEAKFRQIQEEETVALTSYVQRFIALNLFYAVSDNWSLQVGGSLESTIPGPDTLQGPCSPRQLLNSSTLGLTLGVRFDTRSDPVNPAGGVFYRTSYTFGSKDISDPDNCLEGEVPLSDNRRVLRADVESYVHLTGPLVLAGIANFSEVSGDNLEENELWRFGGVNSVRGYRDGLIRASRIAWGRAETRVLLSPVSHASVFFDGGYYLREAEPRRSIEETEDGIYGYGIGLQVDTPVGIARFSFALGKGDTFEEGKVSVGLVGEF